MALLDVAADLSGNNYEHATLVNAAETTSDDVDLNPKGNAYCPAP